MPTEIPDALQILLQIQDKDTQILAAQYQIKELPEREEIRTIQNSKEALEEILIAKQSEVHENNRNQKRLEDEVATIEDRTEKQKQKLYSGEVIAIKELQALEADIENLKERQILLEDQIIEVMELNEPIQKEIQILNVQTDEYEQNETKLLNALTKAIEGIESTIKKIESEKIILTTELSNELLTEYESLRARPGYVGVAKLVNRTCNGCHLDLPAVEVDRIKKLPEDNIINCEECGCILVR